MASYTTNLNLKKPAGSENVAIGDINNNMDAIDAAYGTLNSQFEPSAYTAPTNLNANVSAVQGGYVKVGKLVTINCRLTLTGNISASTEIARFPGYALSAGQVVVANNKKLDISIQPGGGMQSSEVVTSGTLLVSCSYYSV